MQKYFKKFLSLGFITVFAFIAVSYSIPAKGSVTDNVSGFAWEANDWVDKNSNGAVDANETMVEPGGTGWISFNCTSDVSGTCGSSDYGVTINPTTGDITGYAWSSNYGWLKFGGLSGFPTGGGTVAENAKINFSSGTANARPMTGWARFCSVFASGCDGALSSASVRGGWDGWVSFSGTAPTYGVTLNTSVTPNVFSGYAWGGNGGSGNIGKNVVGWISFNCASGGNCGTSDYKVSYNPPGTPTVDIQATPVSGGATTLSWTGQNLASGNSCVGSQTGPSSTSWTGSHPSPSGSFPLSGLVDGTYVFTITCAGNPFGSAVDNVTVVVGAGLDLYADSLTVFAPSYQTTLHWDSVPSGYPLTNCTPSSNPAVSAWDNLAPWNIPPAGSFVVTVPPASNPTRFTLTCYDNGTPIVKFVDLNRGSLSEVVNLSSTAVVNNLTTLSYSFTNIDENTCVATSNPTVKSWDGNFVVPPPYSLSDVEVPPGGDTTYTLTCVGTQTGNLISDSVTLNENSGNTGTPPQYIEN
jgi:hypothetical protein